ncbi:MAG: type II toxin-antitoxin system mRNA interferase toxin, RelE/StbE family [Armatimonadetes bacterium CG_4_10_14_3_um_filter_66_18]|nr:type II toxin-antitoxin system mRNA interferase toxin, RelE/StbE family [Armatimonadota bacterium]OIP04287.1 MAG: plasmid stabilization protein [Armatimonadetes bacterium CG2_30_66_41]PIU92316.1 MAG: type II toxin-antitoxin system mRNA interferase toxin, RelE/StbE family [Armatimonadetes bacterium CG06_land_8_20_14_3_00_66_21]PIX42293.1 MAG: type II toxin-antitoxin system mRNA interferase toxin, RelE/StbE family [Armatimonadetes bacterium CG_4_8_14_3_um_filter_66_20]PIY51275.1 MAG: type II t
MTPLLWSAAFVRAHRRTVRRHPELRTKVAETLRRLAVDPFDPRLHAHKLRGDLAGRWTCTVDYDNRVLFKFVEDTETGDEAILLLTMGTHDGVY